jgi:predicted Zn-dependent protease with MMP-like domain
VSTARSEDFDEALDLAWDALEEGDAQLALERAQALGEDAHERWILEASARLELDDLPGAREALQKASSGGSVERDADLCWTAAEIELREWNLERARELFERTAALDRTTPVLGRLALCADALGDFARADELLAEAQRLDPEGWSAPPRLSEEEFAEVLDEAIGQLDPAFQETLEETQLVVEPMPRRELIGATDMAETPPDMLGLFVGVSRLERTEAALDLPPSIHLFQRNLERAALDREELVSEIRVTLYHELGHMLGFDEEGVERMGLE